jgi:hypothetical protein
MERFWGLEPLAGQGTPKRWEWPVVVVVVVEAVVSLTFASPSICSPTSSTSSLREAVWALLAPLAQPEVEQSYPSCLVSPAPTSSPRLED